MTSITLYESITPTTLLEFFMDLLVNIVLSSSMSSAKYARYASSSRGGFRNISPKGRYDHIVAKNLFSLFSPLRTVKCGFTIVSTIDVCCVLKKSFIRE